MYSAISRKVASGTRACLFDLCEAFLTERKKLNPDQKPRGVLTGDSVHLNAAGNRFVADKASRAIAAAIEERKQDAPC